MKLNCYERWIQDQDSLVRSLTSQVQGSNTQCYVLRGQVERLHISLESLGAEHDGTVRRALHRVDEVQSEIAGIRAQGEEVLLHLRSGQCMASHCPHEKTAEAERAGYGSDRGTKSRFSRMSDRLSSCKKAQL